MEASQSRIGNIGDQVLLYCYHYDPRTGKYGAIISDILKLAGIGTVLILGTFMFVMFRADIRGRNRGRAGWMQNGRIGASYIIMSNFTIVARSASTMESRWMRSTSICCWFRAS